MKNEIENKIICGFAGIGKSYLAKNKIGYVDLESTPFQKNWDLYTDVAIHMQKNGYAPMLSCHKELREKLKEKNANYIVVVPKIEHKANYLNRYKQRGNNETFLNLFEENFENFIEEIMNQEKNVFVLERENLTIADIV